MKCRYFLGKVSWVPGIMGLALFAAGCNVSAERAEVFRRCEQKFAWSTPGLLSSCRFGAGEAAAVLEQYGVMPSEEELRHELAIVLDKCRTETWRPDMYRACAWGVYEFVELERAMFKKHLESGPGLR